MRWVFLSCALALLSACGRSWIFDAFEETSSSTSGGRTTGGSGSSGGRTSASGTGGTGTSGSGASSGGTGCLGAGAFCDPGRCCPGLVCAALEDQGICRAAGTSSGGNASTGSAASGTGTSGGSTGTSTGTSGGTTGGCQQGGAPNELSPCQGDSDCACPLACVPGPGGERLCEYPCQTTADCPALYTICQGGSCQPNLCGGEFDNGTLDGPCNVLGTNDGTCVPEVVQGVTVGLCYQAGPTPSSCDPAATRADLGNACVTGDYCFTSPGGGFPGGGCVPICLPGTACSVAGAAGNCVTALASDPELGVCQLNPSTTGGTGTGGTTGGVTSGGSGGTGGTTGCPSSAVPAEFSPCHTQDDCGCPFICTSDVRAGGQVCEYPCQQTSDCPDLVTVCGNQGACNVDGCGPGTGNGTFNGLCSVPGVGKQDGTCLPLTDDGGISLGYCYQAGTSPETGCDPSGTRGDLSRVCPAGQMCFGGAITFGGTCNQICDPQVGGPCPGGQYCSYIVNEPLLGICIDQNGF